MRWDQNLAGVPLAGRPHTLYRPFDSSRNLLYVGITWDMEIRVRAHVKASPWWGDVADIEYQQFNNRADALAAEWRAIAEENPVHNKSRPMPEDVVRDSEGGIVQVLRVPTWKATVSQLTRTEAGPGDAIGNIDVAIAALDEIEAAQVAALAEAREAVRVAHRQGYQISAMARRTGRHRNTITGWCLGEDVESS